MTDKLLHDLAYGENEVAFRDVLDTFQFYSREGLEIDVTYVCKIIDEHNFTLKELDQLYHSMCVGKECQKELGCGNQANEYNYAAHHISEKYRKLAEKKGRKPEGLKNGTSEDFLETDRLDILVKECTPTKE